MEFIQLQFQFHAFSSEAEKPSMFCFIFMQKDLGTTIFLDFSWIYQLLKLLSIQLVFKFQDHFHDQTSNCLQLLQFLHGT